MSNTPEPCDQDVFQNGTPWLYADTSDCGANGFEDWVVKIREVSGQQVDWHYSGGRAQVLYIGDIDKLITAIYRNPCPCNYAVFNEGEGLYRNFDK